MITLKTHWAAKLMDDFSAERISNMIWASMGSVLEIPTGPPVRGRQLWRRTGNFLLNSFNLMFMICDSSHEDLQLFEWVYNTAWDSVFIHTRTKLVLPNNRECHPGGHYWELFWCPVMSMQHIWRSVPTDIIYNIYKYLIFNSLRPSDAYMRQ